LRFKAVVSGYPMAYAMAIMPMKAFAQVFVTAAHGLIKKTDLL
jgi:hypothetical protein